MDFTREPVIETVITPKEGYKLLIRSSHGENREEYAVDALEVIAFGNSYFFRCLEQPKIFLLPLAEYEVVEIKEARPILKRAQLDKPIRIGVKSKMAARGGESLEEDEATKRKRVRKRRDKKVSDRVKEPPLERIEGSSVPKEERAAPVKPTLLPPPTSLISEQISRYKDYLKDQGVVAPDEAESSMQPPLEQSGEEKVEPISADKGAEELAFPFGGEEAVSQAPQFDGEEPDLFPKESKIVDIDEGEKASIPPLNEDDA